MDISNRQRHPGYTPSRINLSDGYPSGTDCISIALGIPEADRFYRWSRMVRCPFPKLDNDGKVIRDEDGKPLHHNQDWLHPAFSYSHELRVGYCFKCKRTYKQGEIAQVLAQWHGINGPLRELFPNGAGIPQDGDGSGD